MVVGRGFIPIRSTILFIVLLGLTLLEARSAKHEVFNPHYNPIYSIVRACLFYW
jgi:hypothetical protein